MTMEASGISLSRNKSIRRSVRRQAPPPPPRKFPIARALYDFHPAAEDADLELGFSEGAVLEVTENTPALREDGWCRGRLQGHRKVGLLPIEYLEIEGQDTRNPPPYVKSAAATAASPSQTTFDLPAPTPEPPKPKPDHSVSISVSRSTSRTKYISRSTDPHPPLPPLPAHPHSNSHSHPHPHPQQSPLSLSLPLTSEATPHIYPSTSLYSPSIRPCYILIVMGILTVAGSLAPAVWRTSFDHDIQGGYSMAQYFLAIGIFVTGSASAFHVRNCVCWVRER